MNSEIIGSAIGAAAAILAAIVAGLLARPERKGEPTKNEASPKKRHVVFLWVLVITIIPLGVLLIVTTVMKERARENSKAAIATISAMLVALDPWSSHEDGLGAAQIADRWIATSPRLKPEELIQVDLQLGKTLSGQGLYSDAKKVYSRAMTIASSEKAKTEILSQLGKLSGLLGDPFRAKSYYEECVDSHPDAKSRSVWFCRLGIPISLAEMGRCGEALDSFESLRRFTERVMQGSREEAAIVQANQAIVYSQMRRWKEAEEGFEKALEQYREIYGARHMRVVEIYNNKGVSYRQQGKSESAEVALKQAIALAEEVLPGNHPWLAIMKEEMAEVLLGQGEVREANELLTKVIDNLIENLNPSHPHIARARRAKAQALFEEGLPGALAQVDQAIVIQEASFGQEHPEVAKSLRVRADIFEAMGEPQKAAVDRKRISEIKTKPEECS